MLPEHVPPFDGETPGRTAAEADSVLIAERTELARRVNHGAHFEC